MRASARRDAMVLLTVAGALLGGVVVTESGRWLAAGAALARSPLVPVLAGLMLVASVAVLLIRRHATRRALRRRVRVALVPTDSFNPTPEAVLRFAGGLAHARRLGDLLHARANAVRLQLDSDPAGRLRYVVELPAHARPALSTAAANYGEVELHDLPDQPAPTRDGVVVRAELVLARPSSEALRAEAGIDPDPLTGFARALERLRPQDERATICVDLLPVRPGRRRWVRARELAAARRRNVGDHNHARLTRDGRTARQSPAELVQARAEKRALSSKFGGDEPLFHIQVLASVSGPVRGRAVSQLGALLAGFDTFAGQNHFRARGRRLPAGQRFAGADAPWRRGRFDRRATTGLFAPPRRRIVTANEIAGLLKPPTVRCASTNVVRSGGLIPPPPRALPTFHGQAALLPLGRVHTEVDGERIVGVPIEGTFFTYMAGRSRYGKTETGIGQFIHLARTAHGCFFLDPHEDAIERIKHYLSHEERARVLELNFAEHRTGSQPGWNLLAAGSRAAQQQVDAIVDAFASALRWDEINARALNLTTQSAQALTDLARTLPPEIAPTIFQIPTLLSNAEWRTAALPHLSGATRQFFTERFPLLSTEAITPVTNLLDRLRISPPVAAILGNPRSSYDVRSAMDTGRIVLACPGSGSTRDRLIANFLVYDVLHAAKTRATMSPERRRPFFVFLDEVQTYDGASSGNLAALLEQTAKYGIRAFLFNQNPERLTPATLNAVTTNRSHLLTTALNAKAAALLAREWGRQLDPDVITRLERYTYLASITLDGHATPPFLVHGLSADQLFDPAEQPAADPSMTPSVSGATDLDGLDQRILNHLRRTRRRPTAGRTRRPA